jgi:hypothetical protein
MPLPSLDGPFSRWDRQVQGPEVHPREAIARVPSGAAAVKPNPTASAIGKEKDEDADDSESEVTIEKTVLAREVEDRFEPVKSFKPSDTFAVWFS